ncbi:hypothetical protein MHB44_22195 [Lysinibacillus sp. FSL H8-0500]|uniref:Uncharacterized protein n=1 Tax=Lysinibacillus macroides TaxID=33935 RepID=A0A0M9DHC9_9BACI|nr:hypothetical protein [Lysinibacillus macroides]KOY80182.1 hypothetical protein ADM90_23545 [Lysinibacillus macroides]QPR67473.1 hypothetical protein I6G82_19995 [Lysinibacillus macroides]
MALLQDYFDQPICEVEINLVVVNESSVKFNIKLRSGNCFPEISSEIVCMRKDFLKLLDDLRQIDTKHLSMLETHDPGLCIYHIPLFGSYYYPGHGFLQIPEHERDEWEPYYRLIFVLDAGEKNNHSASETGPALCLKVKMEQINEFVESLLSEVNRF